MVACAVWLPRPGGTGLFHGSIDNGALHPLTPGRKGVGNNNAPWQHLCRQCTRGAPIVNRLSRHKARVCFTWHPRRVQKTLNNAINGGYYKRFINTYKTLISKALKDNNISFAVVTGCLKISKESIFTGLNNLSVMSVTDTAEIYAFILRTLFVL